MHRSLCCAWHLSFLSLSCPVPPPARVTAAEMGEYGVAPGQRVAIVWDSSSPVEALKDLVDQVQALVGADNRVSVENVNQLPQCKNELNFSLFPSKGEGSAAVGANAFPLWESALKTSTAPAADSYPGQYSRGSDAS